MHSNVTSCIPLHHLYFILWSYIKTNQFEVLLVKNLMLILCTYVPTLNASSVVSTSSELYTEMDQFMHTLSLQWGQLVQEYYFGKPCLINMQVNDANKCKMPATAEQYSVITPTTYSLLTVHALSVHRVCVLLKFMYFCHYRC